MKRQQKNTHKKLNNNNNKNNITKFPKSLCRLYLNSHSNARRNRGKNTTDISQSTRIKSQFNLQIQNKKSAHSFKVIAIMHLL